jgi:hypothetical protein
VRWHDLLIVLKRSVPPDLVGVAQLRVSGNSQLLVLFKCTLNNVTGVEGLNCKRPIPICRLFFKIDLLTDIAALCLTYFIDWRDILSLVGTFDPACELLPPWTKELYLCTVTPLSSLF